MISSTSSFIHSSQAVPPKARSGGVVFLATAEHAQHLNTAIQHSFNTPSSSLYVTAHQALGRLLKEAHILPDALSPQLQLLQQSKPMTVHQEQVSLNLRNASGVMVPLQLLSLKHNEARDAINTQSKKMYQKLFQPVEAYLVRYLQENRIYAFANNTLRGKESLLKRLAPAGEKERLAQKWNPNLPAASVLMELPLQCHTTSLTP